MSLTSWLDERIKNAETVALQQIEGDLNAKIDSIGEKIAGLGVALDALPGLVEASVERIVNSAFADVTDAAGKLEVDASTIVTQVVDGLKQVLNPLNFLGGGGQQ